MTRDSLSEVVTTFFAIEAGGRHGFSSFASWLGTRRRRDFWLITGKRYIELKTGLFCQIL